MKNNHSLKSIMLICAFALSFSAKAELPPLIISSPPPLPVSLPHTFDMSLDNQDGYIDVDGNGTNDYYINFFSSGTSSYSYCTIRNSNSSSSGNEILTEFESSSAAPPESNKIPLSGVGPIFPSGQPFTTLLSAGASIGDIKPSGSYWYPLPSPYVFENIPLQAAMPNAPLTSNYTNGLNSGYLGLHYFNGTSWYYGYMHVQIDQAGQWVTFGSPVHALASDIPIIAGSDPSAAVPIPIIASILGFGLIGVGAVLKRKKKK